MIKAIVAMAENRVIGQGGTIPWHLPEDFKFFKATTMGHAILMGRKTYESIGKPLPGRENIVLSRTMRETQGVTVIRSLDELKEPTDGRDLFVIGGEEIYRLLLPRVQELYVTKVPRTIEGDTHFPEFEAEFDDGIKILEAPNFSVFWYRRNCGEPKNHYLERLVIGFFLVGIMGLSLGLYANLSSVELIRWVFVGASIVAVLLVCLPKKAAKWIENFILNIL